MLLIRAGPSVGSAQKPRFPSRHFSSDRREVTASSSDVPTVSFLQRATAELPMAHSRFFLFWPRARGKVALLQGGRRQEGVREEREAGEAKQAAGGRHQPAPRPGCLGEDRTGPLGL